MCHLQSAAGSYSACLGLFLSSPSSLALWARPLGQLLTALPAMALRLLLVALALLLKSLRIVKAWG